MLFLKYLLSVNVDNFFAYEDTPTIRQAVGFKQRLPLCYAQCPSSQQFLSSKCLVVLCLVVYCLQSDSTVGNCQVIVFFSVVYQSIFNVSTVFVIVLSYFQLSIFFVHCLVIYCLWYQQLMSFCPMSSCLWHLVSTVTVKLLCSIVLSLFSSVILWLCLN